MNTGWLFVASGALMVSIVGAAQADELTLSNHPPQTNDAGPRVSVDRADPDKVAELSRLRRSSLATRRGLSAGVVAGGILSLVGGVVLVVPETESGGMRVAGVNSLAFGTVNIVVGAIALAGIRAEEAEWEENRLQERETADGFKRHLFHALDDEKREAVSHGINLGLAAAYSAVSLTTIVGSQLGVEHPQRWMASGISIGAQAVFLLVIDSLGTIDADRQYSSISELAASSLGLSVGSDGAGVSVTRPF